MRILLATHARGPIGGVETYLRGLAPALAARGHEVAVLYEHRFEASPGLPDPYAGLREWNLEAADLPDVLDAARAWRPERIWTHGLHSAALERGLLRLAPALLFAHNYDGTCATGAKYQRWPAPQPCHRAMGATCVAVNFTRHCGLLRPDAFASSFRRQRQRRAMFGQYRAIVVASAHMAAELRRHGVANPALVLPYPCWVRLESAPPRRSAPPRHIVMLARLTAAKGGAELLAAAQLAQKNLARPLRVTVAGEGPERDRLRALAHRLDLEADFPGWIAPEARRQLLREADLLALPSLWPEPFGLAGIEAAAHGVPAVAFAVGGIPEWLTPGTGELAPGEPPTAVGLAQAIARALGDPAHWQQLRLEAWSQSRRFDLDHHLDRVEGILRG